MVVWVLLSRRRRWTWSTLGRCVHLPTYTVGQVQDEVLAISSRSVSRLIGSELTSPNSRPCTATTSEAAQTVDHVDRPARLSSCDGDPMARGLLLGWRSVTVEISHR